MSAFETMGVTTCSPVTTSMDSDFLHPRTQEKVEELADTIDKSPDPSYTNEKKENHAKDPDENGNTSESLQTYLNVDDNYNDDVTNKNEVCPSTATTDSNTKRPKSAASGSVAILNKTYLQLSQEAIVALKDRSGSSLPAIKKWILSQHPVLQGPQFNSRLNLALKNGIRKKMFAKVKGSFKFSSEYREAERKKKQKAAAAITKKKKDAEAKLLHSEPLQKKSAQLSFAQANPTESKSAQLNPVQFNVISANSAQTNSTQANSARDNVSLSIAVQSNDVKLNDVQLDVVQSYVVQAIDTQTKASQTNTVQLSPSSENSGPVKFAHMKSGQSKSGQTKSGQSKSGQSKSGQSKSGQSNSGQAKSGQAKSGQAKSGQAKSGQAKSGQAKSGQAKSGQAKSGQSNSGKSKDSKTKVKGAHTIASQSIPIQAIEIDAQDTEKSDSTTATAKTIRDFVVDVNKKMSKDFDEEKQSSSKLKSVSKTVQENTLKQQAAKMQASQRRAEADAKAKALAEKVRKRKYPIEDTKLHSEDKELGLKPPRNVTMRPNLPYFWQLTLPLSDKGRTGKTSPSIILASKVENLGYGSSGLVPDLLQVYHFFRGDVHFELSHDDILVVPEFNLKQLVHSTEQILNGNVRKAKLIPPLLVHLFVSSLQILWQKPPDENDESVHPLSKSERRLREDFNKYLLPALTPVSWSDLCFLYMDAMERYYITDTSIDENVLQPIPIETEDVLEIKKRTAIPFSPPSNSVLNDLVSASEGSPSQLPCVDIGTSKSLPDGYSAYLGDNRGSLYRAHHKLGRQDSWNLTAEELFAILRALTDDILASHPRAETDIAAREDQMYDLLKAKRAADHKYRKVRLAYEGPKKPIKKNTSSTKESESEMKEGDDQITEITDDIEKENNEKAVFTPTVSKKQFESAKKAQEKANDAYEKGIRKLVARTEPIGYDRNHSAVYCFRRDPEVLYIEERKSSNSAMPPELQCPRFSWHVIETTSLFDLFTSSLDIRGKRECDLYEALMGPPGSHQSLRLYLHDDLKEQQVLRSRAREREALRERLNAARIKCDEEKGRRSGRLASNAESELIAIEAEIEAFEKTFSAKVEVKQKSMFELLGMDVVEKFESVGKVVTRKAKDKKACATTREISVLPCSKLCATGNNDGTGAVGMIVVNLLQLEELCESLIPWEKGDKVRNSWILRLQEAVSTWNSISHDILKTPSAVQSVKQNTASDLSIGTNDDDDVSIMKRRKTDRVSMSISHNITSVISLLKQPLLDLEERIAETTNVTVVTKDAEIADENISSDESENDEVNKQRIDRSWKKFIHKLRTTPSKSYFRIRELVVSAISAARKAHLSDVVSKLRTALLLYRPNAAGECKAESIKVLDEFGGYDDEDVESDADDEEIEELKQENVPSVLCVEAFVLGSSIVGSSYASRADWINAVKSVKTLSRIAGLVAAFSRDATEKLTKLKIERDTLTSAIAMWEKYEERKNRKTQSGRKSAEELCENGPSEVWANVTIKETLCMAKVEEFPWWPAKFCEAKDTAVATPLKKLNRCIVALIGEMGGLRVVKVEDTVPFTGERIEPDPSLAEQTKETKLQLDECLAIGRRILRGQSCNRIILHKDGNPLRKDSRLK